MTSFTVHCTHCDTAFPVDPEKVPDGGVRARCTNCEGIFFVAKPAPEEAVTPVERAPEPEPASASAAVAAPTVEVPAEPDEPDDPEVPATAPDQDDAGFGSFDDEIEAVGSTPMSAAVETVADAPEVESTPDATDDFEVEPVAAVTEDFEVEHPGDDVVARVEDAVEDVADEIVPDEAAGGSVVVDDAPIVMEDDAPIVVEETQGIEEAPVVEEARVVEEPPVVEAPSPPEAAPEIEEEIPAVPTGFQFGKRDPHEKARRLARVLVSDMITYNAARHSQALARGTLAEDFEDEIGKSWEEYVDQVGAEMAESTPYWKNALNEVLAGGDELF